MAKDKNNTTAAKSAVVVLTGNTIDVVAFLRNQGLIVEPATDLTITVEGKDPISLVKVIEGITAPILAQVDTLTEALQEKTEALEEATEVQYGFTAPDGERYCFTIPDFRYKGQKHETEKVLEDEALLQEVFETKPHFIKKV
nr:hypothetical protein [uncultured Flavobacterium sp.]